MTMPGVYLPVPTGGAVEEAADLSDILARDIPWETYMTARLMPDSALQLIRRYDKRSPELQASLLDESGPAYVEAFLTVLRNVTKEETVQYILALLLQMLQANPARAALFHQLPGGTDPYPVFLRLLQRSDWFTQEKACKLLTHIIQTRPGKGAFVQQPSSSSSGSAAAASAGGAGPPDPAEQHITAFIEWLCGQLRRPSNPTKSVPTAIAALAVLLREKPCRAVFTQAGGVALLAPLLRTCTGPTSSQLAYELCLCLWQLSYHPPAIAAMATSGVAKGLVEIVKTAQKEKVVRVGLLALRNLLAAPGEPLLASDMLDAGLPKVVAMRAMQSWGDEDIPDVLESLADALRETAVHLSSWDKYKKEVLSGSLDWSPMHTSEAFWRGSVDKFEDKDFQLLRVLLKLLETSRESRTLAVAANDVGRFVEFHPHGRYIVGDLRGKELLMRLMSHPDGEVQKRALLAVQRIMLPKDKLDFLQAASSGA